MVYILCNDFISPGYLIANEQLQGPSKVGNRVTFLAINYFFFPQGKEDREITRNNLLVKLNGQRNRYLLLWNTVHFCAKCGLHSLNINRWQIRIKYLSVVDICNIHITYPMEKNVAYICDRHKEKDLKMKSSDYWGTQAYDSYILFL